MREVQQFFVKMGPWCLSLGAGLTTKLAADKLLGKKITWSSAILSAIVGIFVGYGCGTAWELWFGPNYHLHVAGAGAMFGKDLVLWIFSNWESIMRSLFGRFMSKDK